MLRPEEKEAKQILESHFKHNAVDIEIIEGNDPPDLIAILNDKRIPLEVTCAFDKSFRNNTLENRMTQDRSIIIICNSINEKLGKGIPSNKTLLLTIEGPARKAAKFKKSLQELIRTIIVDKAKLDKLYSDRMETIIEDVPVGLRLVDSKPENKRISAIISNGDAIYEINHHVSLVLIDRIKDKEMKIRAIEGEKWLVIINKLVLASADNFIKVFQEIDIDHSFTKIFLIDNGEVYELFSTCQS